MTITKEQYLEAKETVRKYEQQLRIADVSHRLLPELRAQAKNGRYISIEDFIRNRTTHWTQVDALRGAFEELLDGNHNEEFTYERTSEIFITKGTKAGKKTSDTFLNEMDF